MSLKRLWFSNWISSLIAGQLWVKQVLSYIPPLQLAQRNDQRRYSPSRLYGTWAWIKSPTWLRYWNQIFYKTECSAECSASADREKFSFGHILCQIILNIGMNQESNLIKILKAQFFSWPNVQLNVQLRPIGKNSASVISSARSYYTLSWIKSPTWLRYRRPNFFSRSNVQQNVQLRSYPLPDYIEHCHESRVQPD